MKYQLLFFKGYCIRQRFINYLGKYMDKHSDLQKLRINFIYRKNITNKYVTNLKENILQKCR